jgi:ribosomal protein S18 acetylase RimI-like enzyme
MDIRTAEVSEIDALARLWRDGWRDAHEAIVPKELARLRTPESFRARMADGLSDVRVLGPIGAPLGFCMLKGDELYQLYVSAAARGSGTAATLIADGEARLAAAGVEIAWLACAIGNDRAARFYEKSGWHRARTITSKLETPEGTFLLDVWRYEKRVR